MNKTSENNTGRVNYDVPFYSNTEDETHCFQAALRILLGFFFPDEQYDWEKLDDVTAKVKGLWTWPMAGLLWLFEKGIEIIDIEPFDYEKFIAQGQQYLIDEL